MSRSRGARQSPSMDFFASPGDRCRLLQSLLQSICDNADISVDRGLCVGHVATNCASKRQLITSGPNKVGTNMCKVTAPSPYIALACLAASNHYIRLYMPQSIDSTDTHALSELENLSDSDWLDIASSRASEDTDSVVGFDSDRELDHDDRPTSSHSYRSTSSSRHSEIRAWEGLLEDIPDECHTAARPLTRPTALSSDGAHAAAPTAQEEDPEEEQRVKDALDQSMMSTLSSSRSNTLSGSHSSLVRSRDLRLSFPDPLTSSREDSLNASFEAVAPDDDASPAVDSGADSSPHGTDDIDVKKALTAADPGMLPTPVVPDVEESREETPIKPDFYVVLYGASSAVKWSLIDKLLEKVAAGVGLTLTSRIVGLIDGYVRFLSSNDYKDGRAVWVIDRTDSADTVGTCYCCSLRLTSSSLSRALLRSIGLH